MSVPDAAATRGLLRQWGRGRPRPPAHRQRGWRRYLRLRAGVVGYSLLLLLALLALAAPTLTPYEPFRSAAAPLQAPSTAHPMGTDDLGRDLWTQVLYGARTSLLVALSVAGIAAGVGTILGTLSGYVGGLADDALMRLTEFFQVLPRFFLAVIVVALFGSELRYVVLVLGLTSWTMIARIARAETLSWRGREFVIAARALGASDLLILRRHVLPNILPALVTAISLLAGQAILVEAGLSFLGLGDPNVISWGQLLENARRFARVAWWLPVFPGLAITLAVIGFNLSGDGLNDAWQRR